MRHFMGTSTFAEYTVMPEIALAKVDPAAPLDKTCMLASGATPGIPAPVGQPSGTDGGHGAGAGPATRRLAPLVGARGQRRDPAQNAGGPLAGTRGASAKHVGARAAL